VSGNVDRRDRGEEEGAKEPRGVDGWEVRARFGPGVGIALEER